MSNLNFSDEQKEEITRFAIEHGKESASETFGIHVATVYRIIGRNKEKPVPVPVIPPVLSNDYVMGIARMLGSLQGRQPGEVLEALATVPGLLEELVELRKLSIERNRKPSGVEQITIEKPKNWKIKTW